MDFRMGVTAIGDNRRQHPRLEFHCPVRVEGLKGIQKVTDMSVGGIFVQNEQASVFKKGQTLHLNIKLPTEYEPITIMAKVANVRDRGIGLKFVDLTQSQQQALRVCFDAFKDTIPSDDMPSITSYGPG
jgi:Tfp pilus assembly protein PilZ